MNVGYYFASLGIFISRLASPIYHIGVLKVTAIICYHILMAYFIVSVYSYHRLLKRQKILAQNILELQLQGSNSSLNSGTYAMHNELKRGKKSILVGQCTVCLKD